MTKLTGIVAILSEDRTVVEELRDLGPDPISVKPGRVLPLVDIEPNIQEGYQKTSVIYTIQEESVIRTWNVEKIPLNSLQPYQFFAMLDLSGQKDNLYTFINDLPSPQNVIAKAKLEHTLAFNRDDPLVLQAQKALGLTDETLDSLWKQALEF